MAVLTVGKYVLQLFLAEHAGHTQTQQRMPSGTMHVICSCGTSLSVPDTDA